MRNLLAGLALLAASAASASELAPLGASPFKLPQLTEARAAATAAPASAAAVARKILADSPSLYPLAGSKGLLGFTDSEAEYRAAVSHWSALLSKAGLQPGSPSYKDGMYTLPYSSPDGRVVRRFFADHRQFAPKDAAALAADKALVAAALEKAGLKIVAAPDAHFQDDLPSYVVYYLTQSAPEHEHETQARLLDRGEDIDFDLLEAAGVNVVSKPKPWLMVYVGPQLSFVGSSAPTLPEAQQKLGKRLEYLRGQGYKIIGTRITEEAELPAEHRFIARVYFYL